MRRADQKRNPHENENARIFENCPAPLDDSRGFLKGAGSGEHRAFAATPRAFDEFVGFCKGAGGLSTQYGVSSAEFRVHSSKCVVWSTQYGAISSMAHLVLSDQVNSSRG